MEHKCKENHAGFKIYIPKVSIIFPYKWIMDIGGQDNIYFDLQYCPFCGIKLE